MLIRSISHRQLTLTFLATLFALLFFLSSVDAQDRVAGDKILPKKVFAVATIHNINEAKKRYQATGFSKLIMSNQMADFRDEVINALADPLAELENKFGATLNDLVEMSTGEITVALFQPPRSALDVGILMDVGENRIGLEALLEKMADQFSEWNADHEVKQIEGVDVEVFDFTGQGDEKLQRIFTEMKVLYFIKENRLVMSSSEAAIESILQRWDGQHKRTLASNDDYQAILKKCKENNNSDRTPLFSIFADPVGLMRFMTSRAGTAESGILIGMLPTLGITQIKGAGGTIDLATNDFELISNTFFLVDQPVQGVLRAFTAPTTDQTPPNWVSDKSDLYQAMNWDVEKAFRAISSVSDIALGPGGTEQYLEQLAENELGFNLKTDLLDNLAGTFHIDSKEVDDENSVQSFRFVAEVKDGQKAANLIKSFADLPGSGMAKRDFQGVTIYEYENGEEEGTPSLFSVAVVGNLAMMATPPRLIEQAIRGNNDEPLNQTAAYKAVAKHFPEKTSIRVFQSKKYGLNMLKEPYEQMRKGEIDFSEVEMDDEIREIVEKIDFSKLPSFASLLKYLSDSGIYVVPSGNGVLQKQFFLKPKME